MRWERTGRRNSRAALMMGIAAALVWTTPAAAQNRQAFSIPAGDAAASVQRLAIQAGVQVMAPDADLSGITTNRLSGNFTPIEALRRMLAGKGLEVVQNGAVIVIRRSGQSEGSATGAAAETVGQEIIVTGSRIERTGFDTLQAASTTDAAEIQRRSYTNALEALQDTPGFAPAASSQLGTAQGNLGIAQSFADFFGLGSQRTLTLVNGRRFVSSNTVSGNGESASPGSQVDLNLIPVGLIDRIETVAIGGAPVYGSDAIAGTVNVILKQDYEGVQLTGQASLSERGDAANQMVRGLFGRNFDEGRGNIVVSGEYVRQEGMVLADRMPFRFLTASGNTDRTDGIPAQQVVDSLRYAALTDGGLPYTAGVPMASTYLRNAAGQPVMFGPNGDLVPFVIGAPFPGSSSSGIPIFADGGDGLDPARYTSLLSPNERYLLNLMGNYDVADRVNFFVEGSYAHTSGTKLSDLFQFAAPGILGGPAITVQADNAFLTPQARSIIAANGITSFRINRNFNDVIDRRPAKTELDVFRIVAGLKGDFDVGDQLWNWDASYNYGRSRNRSEFNQINLTRLLNSVDAVRDASGNIVCRVGGDCVPLNIFGENAASDEAVDYVVEQGIGISKNTMEVFSANLGGKLPFGIAEPIAFSIGYEHRTEKGSFGGNDIINAGLTLLNGALQYPDAPQGGFNTDEIYGEAVVPLISDAMDLPVIRSLQAEGAVRYVDHSVAGGDVTWSAGARLQPRFGGLLEGITFRGVYTRAIRNPSIVELFLNPTPSVISANDVCSASRVGAGPNPDVRRANCAAALAAVGAAPPGSFIATTNGASPFGVLTGNANLDNETARSYSFGMTYQPPAIPGLRMALDYSHIKLRNAISEFDLRTSQAACYDSPSFPDEAACQAFSRLTAAQAAQQSAATGRQRIAGDIADGFTASYYNSASRDFAGIIGEIDYRFAVPNIAGSEPGMLRLGVKAFHIAHFRTQTSGGSPVIENAGTLGSPKWDINARIGYAFHPFDLDVQLLWTSKSVRDNNATIEDTPVNDFPSYTLVNTTLGFEVADGFALQFSVRNLFDKKIPYAATVSRSFSVFDPIGRTFTARAMVNF